MQTASNDLKYKAICKKQKEKDEALKEYFKMIKTKVKDNEYLGGVLHEYTEYYKKLLQKRHEQEKALETLIEYLEHIKQEDEQTQTQIQEDEMERKEITKELTRVKSEITDIMELIAE